MKHGTANKLVAGIGNVFCGDDGFGPCVVRALLAEGLGPDVAVIDFGVRGIDLLYALADYEFVIWIDAAPRGRPPGTLYLLDPAPAALDLVEATPSAHSLDPLRVLTTARAMAIEPRWIRLIGCEPKCLESDPEWTFDLSPPVRAAIPAALELTRDLIEEARSFERHAPENHFVSLPTCEVKGPVSRA